MSEPIYNLVTIGNALVDVLKSVDAPFLDHASKTHGINPRNMTLIDEVTAVALYTEMGNGCQEISGGSAANTIACFSSFKGGKSAYIGKVADDALGQSYIQDLKKMQVDFETQPIAFGSHTGRCLVLVEPNGERTMCTYLGAATELGPDDIDPNLVGSAKVTYLEGYLYDTEKNKAAFKKAAEISHAAGHKVSLTLSDLFCVDRHRADFLDLVENHVDILFANEEEIKALYQVEHFEEAISKVAGHCEIAALTCSEKGSVIISGNDRYQILADPVDKVVDTTGAGDAYAAGFLYGWTQGHSIQDCGALGSLAAAEVISHMGARPQTSLFDLLQKKKAA